MTGGRSKRGTLRLFVALDPPVEIRRVASAFGREVARGANGIRAVPPENIHITLAFLGERPRREVETISHAIEGAVPGTGEELAEMALSLGAPVWLPRRRPRALALEIHDDSGRLEHLHADLARELEAATEWRPERAFRPHLTVARTGRGARTEGLELPPGPAQGFEPESVSLIVSRLTPAGAEYDALFTAGL